MRYMFHTNPTRFSRLAAIIAGASVVVAASAVVALAMMAPLAAQTPSSNSQAGQPAAENRAVPPGALQMQGDFIVAQTPGHIRANNLIGATIVSADGEEIGPVSDLIMNTQRELVGVIVSVGGLFGIGDRDIGLPISAFAGPSDVEMTGSIPEYGDPFAGSVSKIITTLDAAQFERAPELATLDEIPGLDEGVPAGTTGAPSGEPQID